MDEDKVRYEMVCSLTERFGNELWAFATEFANNVSISYLNEKSFEEICSDFKFWVDSGRKW